MKTRHIIAFLIFFQISTMAKNPVLKSCSEVKINSKGEKTVEIVYEYDEFGFLTKRSVINKKNEITGYRIYMPDSLGNIALETQYDVDSKIVSIKKYRYDEKGGLVYQYRKYPQRDKEYVEFFENTYDENDNILLIKQFDSDSILQWEWTHEFSEENKRIRSKDKYQGDTRRDVKFVYKKGFLKEKVCKYQEGNYSDTYYTFYKYNSRGYITTKKTIIYPKTSEKKDVKMYKLKYDKHNNVILEIIKHNNKIDSRKYYSYTYY